MSKSIALLTASLGVASATGNAPVDTPPPSVQQLLKSARHISAPAALLPEKWTSLNAPPKPDVSNPYSKLTSSSEPTGYFIANMFSGSNDCSTANTFKYATGTGVCFVGMTNNTAVGSLAYEFVGVSGDVFLINQAVWSSLDCSGTPVVNTFPLPTTCLPSDDQDTSFTYSYSVGASPWTSYEPGFMFQDYDTKEHCAAGGVGGMFAYYGLNQCVRSDEGSFFFSYCDSEKGLYTLVQFADAACQDFVIAVTTKMETCVYQDSSDKEMDPYTYSTGACN